MLALSPILILIGLFLPGSLIARRLGHSLWWASGLVFSLLILFHSAFWMGVAHAPIKLQTVLPILLVISAAAAFWARGALKFAAGGEAAQWDATDRKLLIGCVAVGAALTLRAALSPLLGFDTTFRWDFLARRILATGSFSYYPPLTPQDFRSYFYVDGIPPLVSFTNWWIYTSVGKHAPAVLAAFAAAQFGCTLAFTYGAAAAVFTRRAGILAAAALAACPLFFNAVVIEQETGLTALGVAATLYFLVRAKAPADITGLIAAGLAAALTALSREYGWIAVVIGIVVLRWRRFSWAQTAVFAAVAAAVAGPWYVRSLALTGNPFYSLKFGSFAVNPIHDGIMQHYQKVLGPGRWTPETLGSLLWFLFSLAPLQLVAGLPGAWSRFRERGYLAVAAALLTAVWLQSIGYTSGGVEISTRVLSPALAVLSVAGAGLLERRRSLAVAAILACQAWTIIQGSVYPDPLQTFPTAAFKPLRPPAEFQIADQLSGALAPGARVLTDNAYLHAALIDKGIEVVPVWSPEVAFLYNSPAAEADQKLREARILTIVYYPSSLNTQFLVARSRFYAELPKRWRVAAELPGMLAIFQP